jgi:hypothetical protein
MAKQKKTPYDKVSLILTLEQGEYLRARAGKQYRSISALMRMLLDREMRTAPIVDVKSEDVPAK